MKRHIFESICKNGAREYEELSKYSHATILGGLPIYVMPNDESVSPHLLREGFWESWVSTWVYNNVDSKTKFIDIGANTGYYSILALTGGASVESYEPNPNYYDMLSATKRNFYPAADWTISSAAISDVEGLATLHVPAALHGSASLTAMDKKWLYTEVTVQTQPLTNIVGQKVIIKIDAEGAEEKIWAGMEEELHKANATIILEYTPGAYSKDFIDRLETYAPLKWINHEGEAESIDREWINGQQDWFMMILEP